MSGVAVVPDRRTRRRAFLVLGSFALAAATTALFFSSRGKWSDAVIDSGTEWLYADALSRGELLYRDVVHWFGPFTPYFHAAFFRIFGSSFGTLALAGIVGSLGVLGALHFALRGVTDRLPALAATALAIPAFVFMPAAGGSILGMGFRMWHAAAFALLAVAVAGRSSARRPVLRVGAVGALAGLSSLCRTEWGIAALLASAAVFALQDRFRRDFLRDAAVAVGGFALIFGGTLALFVAVAGSDSVLRDGHVLLTGVPEETRTFLSRFQMVRDWKGGILQLLYSASLWTGAFLLIELVAVAGRDPDRLRRRLPWLAGVFLFPALHPQFGGARAMVLFSAAPFLCLAAIVIGSRRPEGEGAPVLAGFGLLGLLASGRRIFLIEDAPYVGPPLLVALVCASGIAGQAVARERDPRVRMRLRNGLVVAFALLTGFAFVARSAQYSADERVPIPGTNRMLSASTDVARELTGLAAAIRQETKPADGLVVFPEGGILNALTGRPNPLRDKLFLPGYLDERNEGRILDDLAASRPGAVVILNRPTPEYGRRTFGEDYGKRIRGWIAENYLQRPLAGQARAGARDSAVILFAVRKR